MLLLPITISTIAPKTATAMAVTIPTPKRPPLQRRMYQSATRRQPFKSPRKRPAHRIVQHLLQKGQPIRFCARHDIERRDKKRHIYAQSAELWVRSPGCLSAIQDAAEGLCVDDGLAFAGWNSTGADFVGDAGEVAVEDCGGVGMSAGWITISSRSHKERLLLCCR